MNNFLFGAQPIGSTSVGSVTVEHDGLEEAMYESWCEYEDLRGKSEVALCNAYENYIMNTSQSTEQKTALFEGVLGDIWKNVKEFFKKIAAKIKAWWNAVVKWFQSHFQSDAEFLKKYKDEIGTKDTSKFTCSGHPWPGYAKWDNYKKSAEDVIKVGESTFTTICKLNNDEDWKEVTKREKKAIDNEAIRLAKELASGEDGGKGGMGKFKEALKKSFRGKKFENKKNLPGLSVDQMIDVLENSKDKIDDIKEVADNIASAADDYADKIDKAVADAGGGENASTEEKGAARKKVNAAVELAKYSLSYGTAEANVLKEMLEECMGECRSILGAILRYNDKESSKESFSYGGYNQNNTVGLMETFASF